jgi:hypothetical protein
VVEIDWKYHKNNWTVTSFLTKPSTCKELLGLGETRSYGERDLFLAKDKHTV